MTTIYGTVSALKATLSITASTWDTDLTAALTSASRAIDNECGRSFYNSGSTVVRYYTPEIRSSVEIDDLDELVEVAVDTAGTGSYATTWSAGTEFHLAPYNAAADAWPYERLELRSQSGASFPGYAKSVKVSGVWGWPSVPDAISQAAGILASRLFKRAREAPFSVYGVGLDGSPVRISRTDPDVAMLVKPYSRNVMLL